MDLTWLESVLYGLLSGLTDILPVSSEAHKALLLKFFGVKEDAFFLEFLIHLGMLAALYYTGQTHLIRMRRAQMLARTPKKKRKRPLDTRSMMDWSLLKTMLIPALLGLYLYQYTQKFTSNLVFIALFLFLNGIILYIPQFFPTGNRDSRTLSRVEGLLMGLGGTLSVIPGISAVGTAVSISSVCGVERSFGLSMTLLMNLFLVLGMTVYDVIHIVESGMEVLSFAILVRYIVTAAAAFGGTSLGIKVLKQFSEKQGYSVFGIYCWGMALFTFILNLIA